MIQHKENNRANSYGGTNYRTLCNRVNARSSDGANVANADAEVTCKLCLKEMERRTRGRAA